MPAVRSDELVRAASSRGDVWHRPIRRQGPSAQSGELSPLILDYGEQDV